MEQFERFKKILEQTTNFDKIKNSKVAVVGVGGVGSFAVESLARSGIGSIILIDPDIINITNINRQLPALMSTIGKLKVEVLKERILDINPSCNVLIYDTFLKEDNIDIIKEVDYVIDACDTISSKLSIIEYCINNKIKFISCMGTGNKFDPTKLEITDLSKTEYDPLAKVIRKEVNKKNIKGKIMVVSSLEKGVKLEDRTPGSTSFVPSVAGLLCTSYVINDILKG